MKKKERLGWGGQMRNVKREMSPQGDLWTNVKSEKYA